MIGRHAFLGACTEKRESFFRKEEKTLELIHKWNKISLVKRIILGLIVGAILGMLIPSVKVISILGDLFVGGLKALAPLLVFFIVMNALAHLRKGGKTNMSTVVVLYLIGTFAAALTAVLASFAFPSTLILDASAGDMAAPSGIGEVLKNLLMNAVSNPIASLSSANYIGILMWAVIFGLALRESSESTKGVLANLSDALSVAIRWVINCAPFGILGLVFTTVSTTGFSVFGSYVHIIAVLVGCISSSPWWSTPSLCSCASARTPIPWSLSA